jgi:2,4-dienoyl-CoA reductase (NADPH2)
VSRSAKIGTGIGRSTRWAVLAALRGHGVQLRAGVRCREIIPGGVVIDSAGGEAELIAADAVVIAVGQERDDAVGGMLERAGVPFRAAGAAAGARDAVEAFSQGMRAGRALLSLAPRAAR